MNLTNLQKEYVKRVVQNQDRMYQLANRATRREIDKKIKANPRLTRAAIFLSMGLDYKRNETRSTNI